MGTADVHYLEYNTHGLMNTLITLTELDYVSDEDLETIYALGYYCFTVGNYERAKDIFNLLVAHAPQTAYYWRALGAAHQQLKDYPEAIAAYAVAVANDETDIISYVYRAESQILAGDIEGGVRDLEQVLRIGEISSESQSWVDRAEILLNVHKQSARSYSDSELRERVAVAHATFRENLIQIVGEAIETLENCDVAEIRSAAAYELGRLGDNRALEPLIHSVKHDHSTDVRKEAAWALGQFEHSSVPDALNQVLQDERDRTVLEAAAIALGKLGDNGYQIVVDSLLHGRHADLRWAAAAALARLGDTGAIAPLLQVVQNDPDIEVRWVATWAIIRLDNENYTVIKDCVENREVPTRRLFVHVLRHERGDKRAIDLLIGRLQHDDEPSIRSKAAEFLGNLGHLPAVPQLIESLNDFANRRGFVCNAAAKALEKIGTTQALEAVADWRKMYNLKEGEYFETRTF